ncbi:cystathionine beta-synthase-like [Cylas formicarius]|uniref:cystathionine beta-synthase-like n=1 Tax=Cylas formicarius TaxID=197179 RepID=UPI002958935D|nr:cystathionine beta-synthase-like [Cylas formicarius]
MAAGNKPLVYVSPLNERFAVPDAPKKCLWKESLGKNIPSPHTRENWKHNYKIYPDVLSLIGNTPMVKLNKIPKEYGLTCNVFVKCEFLNPGGSVKDRMAKRVFEDAEKQGLIHPGMTIIEPSSGNTGIAVALISAIKGYKCVIVMSEKISQEKEAVITSLGATVVRVPVTEDSFSPNGLFGTVARLRQEIPNSFVFDQFSNPSNPLTHYDTTAEEILDQLDNKVDLIVFGGGTGGTITGIGRKFREISPNTKIVGFDPEGSQFAYPPELNRSDTKFWEVEGMGYEFIPATLDQAVCDYWIKTTDMEALPLARKLMRDEGLLVGMSAGAGLAAAIKVGKELKAGQNVVVILPDSIRNYMTKFVSDQWMEAKGYQPCVNKLNLWWWDKKVSDLKYKKALTVSADEPLANVLDVLKRNNAPGACVLNRDGTLLGTVTTQAVRNKLISGTASSDDPITRFTVRVLPKLDINSSLGRASRILEKDPFAIVIEIRGSGSSRQEIPIGSIEGEDLLEYISRR